MTYSPTEKARWRALIIVAVLVAAGGGYWLGTNGSGGQDAMEMASDKGEVLYYYDPMFPDQKFDAPGKSPFMDMQLVPKYAGEAAGSETAPGIAINARVAQNLGIRTAKAKVGTLENSLKVTGTIEYNERDIAVVQARSGGFVERTYRRAPGDVIAAGAPLADILVPDWGGAQAEYLALVRSGNSEFANAAKARMRLLGMPDDLIRQVGRTGRTRAIYTVRAPVGGAIDSLTVRPGMTLTSGQSLAQINGLGTVWLYGAVPETRVADVRPGQTAIAELSSFPGKTFAGKVRSILPAAQTESRTLTALIELPNPRGQLRPGMFATVNLGTNANPAILVPSEAIIETGERTLVMLASGKGRYRPAEVEIGREGGGQTEILQGLSPGEEVIVSGQFLVDSEASLSGIDVRRLEGELPRAAKMTGRHKASGKIEAIKSNGVTLSHGPVPAINWPAMTMDFRLAKPSTMRGLKKGDRVDFTFEKSGSVVTVTSIKRKVAPQ
ncbi:MAG: efflux RND transporter periplasmic adaptor subunit [Parasphingorhabdus sp.]